MMRKVLHLNKAYDVHKSAAGQILVWIGTIIFSAFAYTATGDFLYMFLYGAPSREAFLLQLSVGLFVFLVGFAFGPLALIVCAIALAEPVKDWIAISLGLIDCCPPAPSSRGVGLILLGPAFVGGSFSTYLLVRYFLAKHPRAWHVILGSMLSVAIWFMTTYQAGKACTLNACALY